MLWFSRPPQCGQRLQDQGVSGTIRQELTGWSQFGQLREPESIVIKCFLGSVSPIPWAASLAQVGGEEMALVDVTDDHQLRLRVRRHLAQRPALGFRSSWPSPPNRPAALDLTTDLLEIH
jgi:hypothetical protein